jgi:hypothetical protein
VNIKSPLLVGESQLPEIYTKEELKLRIKDMLLMPRGKTWKNTYLRGVSLINCDFDASSVVTYHGIAVLKFHCNGDNVIFTEIAPLLTLSTAP